MDCANSKPNSQPLRQLTAAPRNHTATEAQRANGHAILLGLGFIGPGKIVRPRLQDHLHSPNLSFVVRNIWKSNWSTDKMKNMEKHWKGQRFLN